MFGVNIKASAQDCVFEVVIDRESGRILHALNQDVMRPMASTTKVVTCITVIENYSLDKVIEIKSEWTGIEGSSIYLKEGECFTVEELLYGLMLRSGNDCAVALACALAGSIDAFVEKMNELAIKAGAVNSSFKNPHGLDCDGHYTTAYDLALITRYAMGNDIFRKIVSTKRITIGSGESTRVLHNKNKLLSNYEYGTGVKTGYTKKAGRCLVSSSSKNDFDLVCVVLNCGPMFERSEELMNKVYEKYSRQKIASKDSAVGVVESKKGHLLPVYVDEDIYYPLTKEEVDEVEYEVIPYEKERISEKFCQESGTIKIFFKKHLLFERKIFTILE